MKNCESNNADGKAKPSKTNVKAKPVESCKMESARKPVRKTSGKASTGRSGASEEKGRACGGGRLFGASWSSVGRSCGESSRVEWTRGMVDRLAEDYGVEIAMLEPFGVYGKAIVGYDIASARLVYDYDLMVEALAESYVEDGTCESFEDALVDADEWISYNTMRSLPYLGEGAPIVTSTGWGIE